MNTAANLFKMIAYNNKDALQTSLAVAGEQKCFSTRLDGVLYGMFMHLHNRVQDNLLAGLIVAGYDDKRGGQARSGR